MSKPVQHVFKLNETLTLCEIESGGSKGFWLYDDTRGMNLAMRAKTERDAFVEALEYYQKRLTEVERSYTSLKGQVDSFVSQFVEEADED